MANDARFSDIPEHAVRKKSTSVTIDPDVPNPWEGHDITFTEDEIYFYLGYEKYVITEEYNAWIATMPKVHQVTFTWEVEE